MVIMDALLKPPPALIKMHSITSDMTRPQFRKFVTDWNVYWVSAKSIQS